MTELSKKIIDKYLVRKTGKQKKAFREMLTAELGKAGIEAREEKYKDMAKSVNVIVGDLERRSSSSARITTPAPECPIRTSSPR